MKKTLLLTAFIFIIAMLSLNNCKSPDTDQDNSTKDTVETKTLTLKDKVDEFAMVELTTDLSVLSENQKKILVLLIKVARIMDDIYWKEVFHEDHNVFINKLKDESYKDFVKINYGPWERLNGNKPFIENINEKPKGSGFYPVDMTHDEFNALEDKYKTSLYTILRRKETSGPLTVHFYHDYFKNETEEAADLLKQAAELAENEGFKKYLELRAEALLTDEYFDSDIAWMDMKNNIIDFVVGPIETYEDALYGYKAAHEAFLLIKDMEWSNKLERFASLIPDLQQSLPVEDKYKSDSPGSDSDLGVYDAIYYAGDCNAGSKTIAINLPNDEKVRETKGSRKLQLKNSIKAKFDKILVPISDILIAEDQKKHIKFDAFFENIMFHETGHGLGMGNTVDGSGTVREALKDQYTAIEECKADILGLYIIGVLYDKGELTTGELMDNYVTFIASTFRSVRFGISSSHGKANMITFNYFKDKGAFTYDKEKGTYRVDFDKTKEAVSSLAAKVLTIQGDGDYEAAKTLIEENGKIMPCLQKDLDRISEAGIPRDIVFRQGEEILGL